MKINFHKQVYGYIKQEIKPEILQAEKSDPELRKEISRVFQQANRRIQNIESKGLISPAVQAIGKSDIKGFTKFSMRQDWDALKVEYAKAISFLRQPTSTATGTRDYNRHLMQTYDLTKDEFNLMAQKLNDKLTSVSDEQFVERYLMRYKDFTGELEQTAQDVSTQIESEAKSIANAIDRDMEKQAEKLSAEVADNASTQIDKALNDILDTFDKFKI